MLADAIAAERFRLSRDRTAMFWGFGFMPLAAMLFGIIGDLFVHLALGKQLPGEIADPANQALGAVAGVSGPVTALFLLIGASAIFAGDYRWETWRLITPRNTRANLLVAKLAVFAEAAAWSLLLTAVTSVLAGLFSAVINHKTLIGPSAGPAFLSQYAGVTLVTWIEVLLIGALAALVAVFTRSTMGAVITGLVLVSIQSALAATQRGDSWKTLLVPAQAGRLLKTFLTAPPAYRPDAAMAGLALAFLVAWLAILFGGALLLFRRQDLTRE